MSTATTQQQSALTRANEVRTLRRKQRRDLEGQPLSVVTAALIDPAPEFATYKLRALFKRASGNRWQSLIPRLGEARLKRALRSLSADPKVMRRNWHTELALRDLTRNERELLVEALFEVAPAKWREAA